MSDGSVEMHFVPLSGMAYTIPSYVSEVTGVTFRCGGTAACSEALIGIATDVTTLGTAQSSDTGGGNTDGLMQDSELCRQYILCPWAKRRRCRAGLADAVSAVRPNIRAGMTQDEVVAVLTGEAAANG